MNILEALYEYKKKYPLAIGGRLRKHTKIIKIHLNPGEVVKYAFFAQKSSKIFSLFNTYVVVLTNKRIMMARKRLLFGYWFLGITPDMFNDLKIKGNIIWGKVLIDTVKEFVVLSNIPINALVEVETEITEYMMKQKSKIVHKDEK